MEDFLFQLFLLLAPKAHLLGAHGQFALDRLGLAVQ